MKKILIFAIIILLLGSVSAFFPLTHKYIQNELLRTYEGDSEFYQSCIKHPDACFVGNLLSDISVVYYFVDGGQNYIVTHSPSFCISMLTNAVGEVEEACAVGSCLHATTDYQSHNTMVPQTIKKTLLVNSVIHVFGEQHLDSIVENKYPDLGGEIENFTSETWDKCIPLIKKVLTGFEEYDDEFKTGKIDTVIKTFISEVQGTIARGETGYDVSFKNKVGVFEKLNVIPLSMLTLYMVFVFLFFTLSILLIFKRNKGILNYLSLFLFGGLFLLMIVFFGVSLFGDSFGTFITLIKPVSNLVPIGNADFHIEQSIQNGYDLFNQGEQWVINRQEPDASGFKTLKEADESIRLFDYVLISIILIVLFIFIWFNFRRKDIREAFNL